MKKKIKLLCTLGPASFNEKTIVRLDALGVDVFRINLSHTQTGELEAIIRLIRKYTSRPICLDSEGAQIRTGRMRDGGVFLKENTRVKITTKEILGDSGQFSFSPFFVLSQMRVGDLISVDFDSVLLRILECSSQELTVDVVSGGLIGSNKAVTVDRHISMPVMSDKDRSAIRIGRALGITHFALSFAADKEGVEEFRREAGQNSCIISKIESVKGVENIDEIAGVTDALLIDRGDLSREEPVDKIPFIQKAIIRQANRHKVPVYVATNLLESMVKSKKPTRAEVNDVINTLLDGADGLVLAAETAIGEYPVNCAVMISRMIGHFEVISQGGSVEDLRKRDSFLLVEPHGGRLIDRVREDIDPLCLDKNKKIIVDWDVLLNAEQIAVGTFSPLEKFMTSADLKSVLGGYKLSNGTVWPLPIVLQVDKETAAGLRIGEMVALAWDEDDAVYARIKVEDIFSYDLRQMSREMFGTDDVRHPGVKKLMSKDNYFIGGAVDLVRRVPSLYRHYELTPRKARTIFESKGWSRIVGFHTRNVVHRAHEHIQMMAFDKYHCDGLFIHPVVGPKKSGDFEGDIILKCYQMMIERYYPRGKVVLGAFRNYSRYCGPREAVFTALCRKNFGCSHFIVGRDHTGVSDYYPPEAAHDLFRELGDLGICPIFFNTMHFCGKCKAYVDKCPHSKGDMISISGTQAREMLQAGEKPPEWFMRSDISQMILAALDKGEKVFI